VKNGSPLKIYLKSIITSPFKLLIGIKYYSFKFVYKFIDLFKKILKKEDPGRFKKIRPIRYINKNIGKLEGYSNIRALVNVIIND